MRPGSPFPSEECPSLGTPAHDKYSDDGHEWLSAAGGMFWCPSEPVKALPADVTVCTHSTQTTQAPIDVVYLGGCPVPVGTYVTLYDRHASSDSDVRSGHLVSLSVAGITIQPTSEDEEFVQFLYVRWDEISGVAWERQR